jgi:hypothetical protein
VIVALPALPPVAAPFALIDAAAEDDCHDTCVVRSCVELSENVPVAVNCCLVPAAIEALVGDTLIETSAAGVIVIVTDCEVEPDVALIVALPCPTPVATPVLETETTPLEDEAQLIDEVRSCVVPSEYVPVAWNCTVVPTAIDGFVGVIETETSVAGVIVIVAVVFLPPYAPVIVAEPVLLPVARPFALILTALAELVHVAAFVRSCCESSLKYPVSVNCCEVPSAIEALVGDTASDVSVACEMLKLVEDVTPLYDAVTVPEPVDSAVAKPAASICTAGLELAQVTDEVTSCVVPSLYVAVAWNCVVVPTANVGFDGVTVIETSVAGVTVSVVLLVVELYVAVIVEDPAATVVARPFASIVAMDVEELDHTTDVVRSCVVPSAYVPVAVNCFVLPSATEGFDGPTAIELSEAAVIVTVICAVVEPELAVTVAVPTVYAVARPLEFTDTTPTDEDVHVTVVLMFAVEPSL